MKIKWEIEGRHITFNDKHRFELLGLFLINLVILGTLTGVGGLAGWILVFYWWNKIYKKVPVKKRARVVRTKGGFGSTGK